MKLLLDTHAFLWFVSGDARLSPTARELLLDDRNERFVSMASLWEIAIKVSVGKLTLEKPFAEVFPDAMSRNGFALLDIKFEHLVTTEMLPFHHRDPFDRLIIAQGMYEQMLVVTTDGYIQKYGIRTIW